MSKRDAPLPHYGADRQIVLDDLSDRQYLTLFIKRPGMYIGRVSLQGVVGFLNGYDFAARRFGGLSLEGFQQWLLANHPCQGTNLAWWTLVGQLALPDWDFVSAFTPEQETAVLEATFDLLEEFLSEKNRAH
ncbi:hypothetical protein ACQP06_24920 [Nocardia sp. CA-136227]|uniref:hypothetical protein n=1 Tax=Nocardia sp. CA-136227 TaxID=3239979 RepID=UPI003D960394